MNPARKIRIILTGATGMVGEGVLHVSLNHPDVDQVLVINRKPCGVTHPKLNEIIHSNFYDLSSIESQLVNYDACLFCLGVSSIGMNEEEYSKLTYTLTTTFARALVKQNPEMTFCYISGKSTDGSEKGNVMWARVKGKTENELARIFKHAYNFRPGMLIPIDGMKNTLSIYKYLGWLIPLFKSLTPRSIGKLEDLGKAMVHAAKDGYEKQTIEISDIVVLSKRA